MFGGIGVGLQFGAAGLKLAGAILKNHKKTLEVAAAVCALGGAGCKLGEVISGERRKKEQEMTNKAVKKYLDKMMKQQKVNTEGQ